MIKRVLFIMCLVLVNDCYYGYSQAVPNSNLENLFGPSANAGGSSVGQVIDVDRYTGMLKVGLNLFTYQNNATGLHHGINLSYKGGGIGVDKVASCIGLGWSLNTGGCVVRSINGLPDEAVSGFLSSTTPEPTHLSTLDPDMLLDLSNHRVDGEYDEYYFTTNDGGGRFVIGKSGQILQIPDTKVIIERIVGSYSPSSYPLDSCRQISFRVTLLDGTKYVYSNFDCSQLDFGDGLGVHDTYASSSWYLSKIIAPFNKDSIIFNYTPILQSYNAGLSYIEYVTDNGSPGSPSYYGYTQANNILSRMRDMQLTSIDYPDGTEVTFNYDAFDRIDLLKGVALNNITITNGSTSYGYKFNYLYSGLHGTVINYQDYSGTTLTDPYDVHYRLMLDNYKMFSGSDSLSAYSFLYNPFIPVGRGQQDQVDHWGFYSSIASKRVPDFVDGSSSVIVERDADAGSQYSSLSEIVLPSGGNIRVEYENNEAVINPVTLLEDGSFTGYSFGDVTTIVSGNEHILPSSPTPFVRCYVTITPVGSWPSSYSTSDELQFNLRKWNGTAYPSYYSPTGFIPAGSMNVTFSYSEYISHTPKTMVFNWNAADNTLFYTVIHRSGGTYDLNFDNFDIHWVTYSGPPVETIGGIRVKKLIQSDTTGQNNNIVHEFKYMEEDGINSSGKISAKPEYDFDYKELYSPETGSHTHPSAPIAVPLDLVGYSVDPGISGGTTYSYSVYSSAAENSLVYSHGSPVGYDRVEEYVGNSTNYIKKFVYKFSNEFTTSGENSYIGTGLPGNPNGVPFVPQANLDFEAGLLRSIYTYSGSGLLLEKTINDYDIFLQPHNEDNFRSIKSAMIKYGESPVGIGDFRYQNYYPTTGKVVPTKTTQTTYFHGNDSMVSVAQYTFDTSKMVLRQTLTTDSRNVPVVAKLYYPYDFSMTGAISTLQANNMVYSPIRAEVWKDTLSPKLVKSDVTLLQQLADGSVKPKSSCQLTVINPVSASTWGTFDNTQLLQNPTLFTQNGTIDKYDGKGNVLQTTTKGSIVSTIWNFSGHVPIATVTNAEQKDVAYTSFEGDDWGGWTPSGFVYAGPTTTTSYTGTGVGIINVGGSITKDGLDPGTMYVLSFWNRLYSTSVSVSTSSGALTMTTSDVHNGWQLCKATFSGCTSITLYNPSSVSMPFQPIDELRLYPLGAQMTTTTYDPLFGITSKCDASNRATKFEYDGFGRIKLARDIDGNIIKKFDYAMQEPQH